MPEKAPNTKTHGASVEMYWVNKMVKILFLANEKKLFTGCCKKRNSTVKTLLNSKFDGKSNEGVGTLWKALCSETTCWGTFLSLVWEDWVCFCWTLACKATGLTKLQNRIGKTNNRVTIRFVFCIMRSKNRIIFDLKYTFVQNILIKPFNFSKFDFR